MKRWVHFTWLVAILASLGLYAVAIWFGELNQDEGWYLYAGRLVAEGQHPFIDFASTQGPVMAYVYALAQPLVRLWGVAGGRIFTAILGFATALCAARLAYRITRHTSPSTPRQSPLYLSALLTFSLIGLNLYHVYFTSLVKTYSLAGLFVVLGFLALEKALRPHRPLSTPPISNLLYAALSASLFALAAGVRLSAGILLPTVWLTLLYVWFRGGHQRAYSMVLIGFLLGGSLVLLAIYLPFMFCTPEALKFGLLEYHAGRSISSVPVLLAYKAGFLIRLVGSYFPLMVLGVGVSAVALAKTGFGKFLPGSAHPPPANLSAITSNSPPANSLTPFPHLLYTSLIMVTLVHLSAAFPYDDYQVFIMPLLAVVIGYQLSVISYRFSNPSPLTSNASLSVPILTFAFICIVLAHSASSPLLQNWLLAKRDRIWWPLRTETSLQSLQRSSKLVQTLATSHLPQPARHNAKLWAGSTSLLTQDTYLAVESGLPVPKGMELGPFCYFPDMETEKAKACHVLNRPMMQELLASAVAPIAAFSGYGLAIQCPDISQLPGDEQAELWRILETRYSQSASIESFGQADTTLRIFTKK